MGKYPEHVALRIMLREEQKQEYSYIQAINSLSESFLLEPPGRLYRRLREDSRWCQNFNLRSIDDLLRRAIWQGIGSNAVRT